MMGAKVPGSLLLLQEKHHDPPLYHIYSSFLLSLLGSALDGPLNNCSLRFRKFFSDLPVVAVTGKLHLNVVRIIPSVMCCLKVIHS